MKAMKSSLKLLYQNGEMWAWYFILLLSIYHIVSSLPTPQSPPTSDPINSWGLISPNLALAVLGCAMGRVTAGIWSKPIFFSLPGQIRTTWTMLLIIGLAASVITSLIMTILLPLMASRPLSIQITLTGFYLMIYSLCVIISIRFYKLVFFIPYFILFSMQLMNRMEILSYIQSLLLSYPWKSALVCWAVNFLVYYALGIKHLPVRLFGMPSVIFFTGLESPGSNTYHPARFERETYLKKALEWTIQFFLGRIHSNNRSSVLPHVWGRIYNILGSFISNWRVIFFDGPVVFLSAAIFINSFRIVELQSFLYGFIGLLCGHICVISGADIFLPIDLIGRFISELTALITAIFTMFVLAAFFDLLSKILPHSITSFINLNWSSEFISLNVKYIFLTMILLPVTCGVLILLRKRSVFSILTITGLAIFLLGVYYHIINKGLFAIVNWNPLTVVLAVGVSFSFYLSVIYFGSTKRSLA
ncbi:MAG: hypothetical protein JW944_11655 [Deltaproteobacteria bacterium]|nr:hypothetical protein [Deltaproteobacteria bacterium]